LTNSKRRGKAKTFPLFLSLSLSTRKETCSTSENPFQERITEEKCPKNPFHKFHKNLGCRETIRNSIYKKKIF